jgi:hypothetical protein
VLNPSGQKASRKQWKPIGGLEERVILGRLEVNLHLRRAVAACEQLLAVLLTISGSRPAGACHMMKASLKTNQIEEGVYRWMMLRRVQLGMGGWSGLMPILHTGH